MHNVWDDQIANVKSAVGLPGVIWHTAGDIGASLEHDIRGAYRRTTGDRVGAAQDTAISHTLDDRTRETIKSALPFRQQVEGYGTALADKYYGVHYDSNRADGMQDGIGSDLQAANAHFADLAVNHPVTFAANAAAVLGLARGAGIAPEAAIGRVRTAAATAGQAADQATVAASRAAARASAAEVAGDAAGAQAARAEAARQTAQAAAATARSLKLKRLADASAQALHTASAPSRAMAGAAGRVLIPAIQAGAKAAGRAAARSPKAAGAVLGVARGVADRAEAFHRGMQTPLSVPPLASALRRPLARGAKPTARPVPPTAPPDLATHNLAASILSPAERAMADLHPVDPSTTSVGGQTVNNGQSVPTIPDAQAFAIYGRNLMRSGVDDFHSWHTAMTNRFGPDLYPGHWNGLFKKTQQTVGAEFVPSVPAPRSMTIKSQPGNSLVRTDNSLVQPGQKGKAIFQTPQELEQFVQSRADGLRAFAQSDPQNYRDAVSFYGRMADAAIRLATDPRTGHLDPDKADLITRYFAHNSPQASVKSNFTMAFNTGVTPETSGTYRGVGGKSPGQGATRATRELHEQWTNGQPFVAYGKNGTPGVGSKVWSFYTNGMTEVLNKLEARGFKIWNADGTPGPDMPQGVHANTTMFGNRRMLDGVVTSDMWHQAYLGEAYVGYRYDPETGEIARNDKGRPVEAWSWVDPSSAKTVSTASPLAQNALREIAKIGSDKGVTSFDQMTPQSQHALRYDPKNKTITVYTKDGSDGIGGVSHSAYQRLQELTGRITDRINAQGGINGQMIDARTGQSLAWARIRLAHPDPKHHNTDSYDKYLDELEAEYQRFALDPTLKQESDFKNTPTGKMMARYANDALVKASHSPVMPAGSIQHMLVDGPVPSPEQMNASAQNQFKVHRVVKAHLFQNGKSVTRNLLLVTGHPEATPGLASSLSSTGLVYHDRFPRDDEYRNPAIPLAGHLDIPLPKSFSVEKRKTLLRNLNTDPLLVYEGKPLFQDAYIAKGMDGQSHLILRGSDMGLQKHQLKALVASNRGIISEYLREVGVAARPIITETISHAHENFPTNVKPARNIRRRVRPTDG